MRHRSAMVVGVLLAFLPLDAKALEVFLDPVDTKAVQFTFKEKTPEPVDPVAMGRAAASGSSPSYDIWMEPGGVTEEAQLDYFLYQLYVRPKHGDRRVMSCTFQGRPGGSFDDQFTEVTFRIDDGTVREQGTIVLPIFGSIAPDALGSTVPEEPYQVFLSTEEEIRLRLTNKLQAMPVSILSASPSARTDLWQSAEIRGANGAFAPFLLGKGATNETSLRVRLHPRSLQAFATALIRGREKVDDVVKVEVRYKTLAREETPVTIHIPIRFKPWPPFLLLMAAAGAVVGWLVLLLVKARKEKWPLRFQILGAAVAAGILIEMLGMLFDFTGGEVKFLTIKMDPFQMLPAALVGFVAGLAGYQSRDLLRRIGNTRFWPFGPASPGNTCLAVVLASMVFGAVSLSAAEVASIASMSSGDLVVLNATTGIERISGARRARIVGGFGTFQATELAIVPLSGSDTFVLSLQIRGRSNSPFARLRRYNAAGRQTDEWSVGEIGGVLGGVAVDPRLQIAYCTDSRLKSVYQLDLKNPRAPFVPLVKIRDAGILGPIVLDTRRKRLLVADVENGTILSIMLDTRKVETVVGEGMLSEPLALALDANGDRLYIADGARKRIWVGTPLGNNWNVERFPVSQDLDRPSSLAVAPDGSLWVADRVKHKVWLFATDGRTLRTVNP